MIATHAPEVNLLMPTVMKTAADSLAPTALKQALAPVTVPQTPPVEDHSRLRGVNARNTPTAYSGISVSV